jgi:hypothetical protein
MTNDHQCQDQWSNFHTSEPTNERVDVARDHQLRCQHDFHREGMHMVCRHCGDWFNVDEALR